MRCHVLTRTLAVLLVLAAALPATAVDEVVEVEVSTDGSAEGLRILLTHSREVAFEVRPSDDRIDIVYGMPVRLRAGSQRFPGSPVQRLAATRPDTLSLKFARSYERHQIFDLHNPFRLVIDVAGAGSEDAAPSERPPAPRGPAAPIVVLDPGHGGVEHGAVGPSGLREKDVALDLARRVRRLLQDDGVTVVLTRDEDRLVGLDERTATANHNRADLFLSIHLNSSPRASARGAETYFLASSATDAEARTLAALENRASGVEESALGADEAERHRLDLVLWDLAQNRFLAESSALAEAVQAELNRLTGTRDRGVRQAPFRVLMGATMPAILVEVGFISNPEEEDVLQTATYRNHVAEAIRAAVRGHLDALARQPGPGTVGLAVP